MLVVVLGVAAASVVPEVGRWPGRAALAQTIAGEATPAIPAQVTVPNATAGRPRLLRAQQDIFLVEGRRRRWVVSPQVFTDYRFGEAWVAQVSEAELTSIPLGPDLVAGPVLRAPDGEVWIVYDGTRPRSLAPSVAEAPGPPGRPAVILSVGLSSWAPHRHPERSEGSVVPAARDRILHAVQDDKASCGTIRGKLIRHDRR